MKKRVFTQLFPFAAAFAFGMALERVVRDSAPVRAEATATMHRGHSVRSHREAGRRRHAPPELDRILSEYEASEEAWIKREVDPFADYVADWSEGELETALAEALETPRCIAVLGGDGNLLWSLFGAWMKRNPDAAVAWIGTVKSAELRDKFVRAAGHVWPANRSMEGIDFFLTHRWKKGGSCPHELLARAIESQARLGASKVVDLLRRLNAADSGLLVDDFDLPSNFDYRSLVQSEAFRDQNDGTFKKIVFSKWREENPEEMLEWMRKNAPPSPSPPPSGPDPFSQN